MKCDELTTIDLECNMGKDINGVEHREPWKAYDIDEVNAAIAELKAELKESEEARYEAGADAADYYQENRNLKRTLWLARANSAEGQFFYWCARFGVESGFTKADIRGYSVNKKRRLRTIGEWIEYWKNVKSKCIKKAEEYK